MPHGFGSCQGADAHWKIGDDLLKKSAESGASAPPRQFLPPPPKDEPAYKAFDSIAEAQAYAMDEGRAWAEALDESDAETLRDYKGYGADMMNRWLRGEVVLDENAEYEERLMRDQIDAAISAGKLRENVWLFRGVNLDDLGLDASDLSPGVKLTDPGYCSTSLSEAVAGDFGHIIYHIRAPAGTPCAFLEHVRPNNIRPEAEILLERGVTFVIEKVEERVGGEMHVFGFMEKTEGAE